MAAQGQIQPETFERYGARPIPRYTSYPTAPSFSPAIDEEAYRGWLAALPAGVETSLYLHIPFCRSMCWYCGCHTTVTARDEPVARYLAALNAEIELIAGELAAYRPVTHIHFGGGSPTLIPPAGLLDLMERLRSRFAVSDDAEIAVEIDPRTLSAALIQAFAEAGVNRASIGVQSFDPEVQRAINRLQSFEVTAAAVDGLRANGIGNINFDLIYGLPRQTVASCLETVELALRLRPDRLAVFGYAHVPHFKLHQRKLDPADLPEGTARIEQSISIAEALREAGYVQIGLDHFASRDDPLAKAAADGRLRRNFQGYTTDAAPVLIGLGSSSIGRLPQGYVQNIVLISEYQKRIAAGRLPIARGYAVSADDRLRAVVIERLMCAHEVDLAPVCAAFGVDPARFMATADLETLVRDGLIALRGTSIEVNPEAYPLVRSVAAAFDAHLPRSNAVHARAV